MSRYSVVVVARDHPRQLLGTLLALRKRAQPYEVVLVDNASTSNLAGVVALSQLPVRRLSLAEHRSLGEAFNAGLDAAESDFVLLLHSDVLLESDPAAAIACFEQRPEIGVIGGKLFQDGEPPRRVLHAGYAVGRGRVGPKPIGRLDWDRYHAECEVAAVSDACMIVRRTDVRFDERYWFALEDVDLCHQYRQRGYQVLFLPALQAVHLEHGGVQERKAELSWAVRQLATQWLYHERWCSDTPLEQHPRQVAMRGQAALDHFREVEAAQLPAHAGLPLTWAPT